MEKFNRQPQKDIVKKIVKIIKSEAPDYIYLRDIFRKVRENLEVEIQKKSKKLPYVPTEESLKKFYTLIKAEQNIKHIIIIRVLLYTGVRVAELVDIKIDDIDFKDNQIKIRSGKGNKSRVVPFPELFNESLLVFARTEQKKGAEYLFESIQKKKFTTRGISKILEKYTKASGISDPISPHKLRHFLFTWMKKQGIDDAQIQPFSGHESRKSLEVYSKLSLSDVQKTYEQTIKEFPI